MVLRVEWRAFLPSVFRLNSGNWQRISCADAKNKNKEIKNAKADGIIVMETRDLLFLIALKYINQNGLQYESAYRDWFENEIKPIAIREEWTKIS